MEKKIEMNYAGQSDIPQLRQLWKETFGDEDWYLDLFFEHIFSPKDTLVGRCSDKIVAMLYMVPYRLKCQEELWDIIYLYALATDMAYRGRGIMSSLLQMSEKIVEERGCIGSFLIPAEERLWQYYRERGFTQMIGREGNCCEREYTLVLNEKQKLVQREAINYEQQITVAAVSFGEKGVFRANQKRISHLDVSRLQFSLRDVLM